MADTKDIIPMGDRRGAAAGPATGGKAAVIPFTGTTKSKEAHNRLLQDFRDWSGGNEPHETHSLKLERYITVGRPGDWSEKDVRTAFKAHTRNKLAGPHYDAMTDHLARHKYHINNIQGPKANDHELAAHKHLEMAEKHAAAAGVKGYHFYDALDDVHIPIFSNRTSAPTKFERHPNDKLLKRKPMKKSELLEQLNDQLRKGELKDKSIISKVELADERFIELALENLEKAKRTTDEIKVAANTLLAKFPHIPKDHNLAGDLAWDSVQGMGDKKHLRDMNTHYKSAPSQTHDYVKDTHEWLQPEQFEDQMQHENIEDHKNARENAHRLTKEGNIPHITEHPSGALHVSWWKPKK